MADACSQRANRSDVPARRQRDERLASRRFSFHRAFADRRLMAQISTDTGDSMRKVRAGGIAIMAVVLGLALAGCGSDEKKAEADHLEADQLSRRRPHLSPGGGRQAQRLDSRLHQAERHHRNAGEARRSGISRNQPSVPARLGGHGSPDTCSGLGAESSSPATRRWPPTRRRSSRCCRSCRATSTRRRSSSSRRAR